MELHPLVAGIAEDYELGRPGYPEDVARAIADAAGIEAVAVPYRVSLWVTRRLPRARPGDPAAAAS